MKLNLTLTPDQMLELINRADKVEKSVDDYILDVLFDTDAESITSKGSILYLDKHLREVIESCKATITEYEKGFVFVKSDILPYARQVISKEHMDVIDDEVISSLQRDGIISLWSNGNHPWQYIRE